MKAVPVDKKLQLRADSAFYIWRFIGDLEEREVIYAITADQTKGAPHACMSKGRVIARP